jgi:hypothetical protein
VVVGTYALAGELQTFYYWFFRYGIDVYMAPFRGTNVPKTLYLWARGHSYLAFAGVVLFSSVAGRHLGPLFRSRLELPEAYARRGFDLTLVWLALLSVAAAFSTLRMWPQHDLPPIPWFSLLIGVSVERAVGYNPYEARTESRPWGSLLFVSLLLTVFSAWIFEQVLSSVNQLRQKGYVDARPEPACEHINQLVPPKAPLFIWGSDGDLYITCQRHAASRYVDAALVAGIVPPESHSHEEWVARDAVENLIADLEGAHTPLILDSPSRLGVSITQIKPLERYLKSNYCAAGSFRSKDGRPLTAWLRLELCPKPVAAEPGSANAATAALPATGNPAN